MCLVLSHSSYQLILKIIIIPRTPSSSVVKILPSNAGDVGSIPGLETKIPRATPCGQKKKKHHYSHCTDLESEAHLGEGSCSGF